MAGVGFELRELFRPRAAGHIRSSPHAALATGLPFALLAGMVLVVQFLFFCFGVSEEENRLYIASVAYAFLFSQIIASGFGVVLARYVSDCLSRERCDDVVASLFGMTAFLAGIGCILAALFLLGKPLDWLTKLLVFLLFSQLMVLRVQSVYLSAAKRFERLLAVCLIGVLLCNILALFFLASGWLSPVQGALLSMNCGTGVIVLLSFLRLAMHFGMPGDGMNFAFLPHLERHWRLFAASLCFTFGIFLPNMIVWQGPWGMVTEGTFRFSPVYDVVMFYAFFSILPLMAMFAVSVETNFYACYAKYFSSIVHSGNFREIDDARKELIHTLWFEMRHIMEFQLVVTLVFLSLGNYFLSWTGSAYSQVNMFNVMLFGAFFTGILQIICILLIYFDDQQDALKIAGSYLGGNLALGLAGFFWWGEQSYGFTFFLASAISLFYGIRCLNGFLKRVNYFVFCTQTIFYLPPQGFLTGIARRLYGNRLPDPEGTDPPGN